MTHLTQIPADILCTIIAVGFISNYKKIPIVYTSQESLNAHKELERLLARKLNLIPADPKNVQPMIYGQTGYIYGDKVRQGIADEFQTNIKILHHRFNEKAGGRMPGAYIGGRVSTSNLLLNSPSALHLYEPFYRTADDAKVCPAYNLAKSVTDAATKFLLTMPQVAIRGINIIPDRAALKQNETVEFKTNHIFGSCHGMILALNDYRSHLGTTDYCIELALGDDTNKVASCLPCGLFMAANGYPPSAMHLGCGDNWHPPKKNPDGVLTQNWKDAVIGAYLAGLEMLKGPKIAAFVNYRDSTDRAKRGSNPVMEIPEMFLEALTFESPMINKMDRTLR